MLFAPQAFNQTDFSSVFSTFRLEARADFDYFRTDNNMAEHEGGFTGRYFNLKFGGNISEKFSYYVCQRLVANPGSHRMFDNTDFLYLGYAPNKNWMFKAGKDALAVGGYEYDAAPIDVLFNTTYWDNIYCFQIGGSAAYITDDGAHTILAQVANSPYVHTGADYLGYPSGSEWKSSLFSYSLFWKGKWDHFKTLYSVNMFQRPDRGFLNYIALGNQWDFESWDIYVDLIHHSLATNDWGNNFAIVSRANFQICEGLSLFVKGAYEQNLSSEAIPNYGQNGFYDCLLDAGSKHAIYGAGFEYRPASCKDVRLHAYVANRVQENTFTGDVTSTLNANIGITWNMNIRNMFN